MIAEHELWMSRKPAVHANCAFVLAFGPHLLEIEP